jgi:hypothetical protein
VLLASSVQSSVATAQVRARTADSWHNRRFENVFSQLQAKQNKAASLELAHAEPSEDAPEEEEEGQNPLESVKDKTGEVLGKTGDVLKDGGEKTVEVLKAGKEHLPSHSQFSWWTTRIFGAVWVGILGSVPLLIYSMDTGTDKITCTAFTLSIAMWVALFGGFLLFTNIILFTSAHFDEVRPLTVIECAYFMTQVITTVGYGDITPAKTRGKIFVGVYVVLAFFVIALLVSQLQAVVVSRVNDYKEKLKKRMKIETPNSDLSRLARIKPEKPDPTDCFVAAGCFVVIAAIWVIFFHEWPGEEKTWLESCYMALITLTTVGFGAVTPVTEGGMMFSSFFMIIGTGALVSLVTHFSSWALERVEWEAWAPEKFQNDVKALADEKLAKTGGLSELDFLCVTLVHKHILSAEQVKTIRDTYASMSARRSKIGGVSVHGMYRFAGIETKALHGMEWSPRSNGTDDDTQDVEKGQEQAERATTVG